MYIIAPGAASALPLNRAESGESNPKTRNDTIPREDPPSKNELDVVPRLILASIPLICVQLLYLDASGDPGWPPPAGRSRTRWYVLAGLSLDDEKWNMAHWRVDRILHDHFGTRNLQCRELRYSSLVSGVRPFDALTNIERRMLADDIFKLIGDLKPVLFAAAIDKTSHKARFGRDAISPKIWALQLVATRFDRHLSRKGTNGIMMMDAEEARKDRLLKELINESRRRGMIPQSPALESQFAMKAKLTNLIESVLFVDSRDSPMIQLVDFCSYAIWNHFENRRSMRFEQLRRLFDSTDGDVHGLGIWPQ